MRERARWGLVSVLCVAALCAPALWNGFPLLQYDTGGYLVRWYEGYLVPSRAVLYGLFLNAGQWWNFWPVVVVQAALTTWVVALMLRVHGFRHPLILLGTIGGAVCLHDAAVAHRHPAHRHFLRPWRARPLPPDRPRQRTAPRRTDRPDRPRRRRRRDP